MARKKVTETQTERAPVAETKKIPAGLYAYADFRIDTLELSCKAGELFKPPGDWERDLFQENFLLASKKKNASDPRIGMVFSYPGEVVNPQERNKALWERRTHTVVLPLEER